VNRFGRFAVGMLALATVASCGQSESAREAEAMKAATPSRVQPDGSIRLTDADRGTLGLQVQSATEADLPDSMLRFGRVVSPPGNEAQVVSPVTGRITRAPRVQVGDIVTAGALLVDIEPNLDVAERISVGTQAAQRQGEIGAAEQELAKAEADLTRARALSPHVMSAAQVQQAETAVAVARARLEGLEHARTAETTARTQAVSVPAPIGGAVADLTATVGALVTRGDVLARLVRSGPLWIDVSVPPDAPIGDRYEVITGSGPLAARLIARGRLSDVGGTRTDRLAVETPTASVLTPGATVSVRIGHGATRGIVLPDAAIVPGVESDTVFIEREPGFFVARPVQVATRFGGQVRLASGVKSGERVVIRGGMALEGELVRSQLRPAG